MKFLVQCTFRETVTLNGLIVDSVDFTVEAPNSSIAEQKVASCYPDIAYCNVELIETEDKKLKYFFIVNLCVCVAVYFLLKPYQNDLTNWPGIFDALINGLGWFIGAFIFGTLIYCIVIYGVWGLIFKKKNDVHSVEKEYSYRLGYKDGWKESEHKLQPKFIHWAEQDSKDIEPKLGPAKKLFS